MNKRSTTACALALAFLAVFGRLALAQDNRHDRGQDPGLPPGWVVNWDGSGTYVFLGSPGTGNVGRTPGNFDIPQATYSARHPGWYDQLIEQGWNNHNHWQDNDEFGRQYRSRHGDGNRQTGYAFSDQDRQATNDWYRQNRRHLGAGWAERDRLSADDQRLLRPGQRLDPRFRRRMHWLPADLSRRYGPAPRGYRYAVIGGNVVMLDNDYQVHDVFRIDIQIR